MKGIEWGEWTVARGFRERNGVLGKWGINIIAHSTGEYSVSVVRYLDDGGSVSNVDVTDLPENQLGGFACELIRNLVNETYEATTLEVARANFELFRAASLKEELKGYVFN